MATVRYLVNEVEASIRFYVDLLGFEVAEDYAPAMAIVRREDLTLWLAGPLASAARPMPDGAQPVPGGWNRFVVTTDDLEALIGRPRLSDHVHVGPVVDQHREAGANHRQRIDDDHAEPASA